MTDQLQRDPQDWKTGDEPMTDAQASYLRTLSEEAGEPFDENLTKAEASQRIDALRDRSPRVSGNQTEAGSTAATDEPGGTAGDAPPHASQAEGDDTEGFERPQRPSQAEGEG